MQKRFRVEPKTRGAIGKGKNKATYVTKTPFGAAQWRLVWRYTQKNVPVYWTKKYYLPIYLPIFTMNKI